MTKSRNVRAAETREEVRAEEARPKTAWKPPSLLDAPKPRPGMVQRWVTTSIQGRVRGGLIRQICRNGGRRKLSER